MFGWSSFVFMVSVIKIVHRNLFLAQTVSDISSLSLINISIVRNGTTKVKEKSRPRLSKCPTDLLLLAPTGSPGHLTTEW